MWLLSLLFVFQAPVVHAAGLADLSQQSDSELLSLYDEAGVLKLQCSLGLMPPVFQEPVAQGVTDICDFARKTHHAAGQELNLRQQKANEQYEKTLKEKHQGGLPEISPSLLRIRTNEFNQ